MHIRDFTYEDYPALVAIHQSQGIVWPEYPHTPEVWAEALPFFIINTLALGLACAYLMIKSDSLWGSVIMHAASDFFLFVAVLANA